MEVHRIAVVGVGSFGRHHARHLASHPAVAHLSVVDADMDRARAICAEHGGTPAHSVEGVDAAVITVPTEYHATIAAPLLESGVHCFVEKPIAATPSEAEGLVEAAARGGAVLQVGHIERHSAVFEALSGAVQGVRYVAARRLNMPRPVPPTVDVVLDLMIHDIDLVMALVGAPMIDVETLNLGPTPAESIQARLHFASGAIADIAASRQSPVTERTLVVHDTAGVYRADLAAGTLHRCSGTTTSDHSPAAPRDNLRAELDDFFAAIAERRQPLVDGPAGLSALRVAERIRASVLSPTRLSA